MDIGMILCFVLVSAVILLQSNDIRKLRERVDKLEQD